MIRVEWTPREKKFAIALGVALILLVVSLFWNGDDSADKVESGLQAYTPLKKENKVAEEAEKPSSIVVDVKGAVQKPGIYTLGADARVYQAIQQAGGSIESADLKRVNMAQSLTDGMVVYIPRKGEQLPQDQVWFSTSGQDINSFQGIQKPVSRRINVNLAPKEELEQLPGIGASKAEAIIRYREQHGKFRSIDELTNVPGIGEKTLDKFRDRITVSYNKSHYLG